MMITTKRLSIRPIEFSDWPALQRIALNFQASPYRYFDREMPTSDSGAQNAARYFASTGLFFAVLLKEQMIGYVCFHPENRNLDLGYCFHSDYHGQGYAFEACSTLMTIIAHTGAINRFTAGTALENTPSIRLLQKLGCTQTTTETVCFYENHPFTGGTFQTPPLIPKNQK